MEEVLRAGLTWPRRLSLAATQTESGNDESAWQAWRTAVDPDDAGLFERRLSWAGLTETAARNMLVDIPVKAADWLEELQHLQAAARTTHDGLTHVPFAPLLAPLVADVWERLCSTCDAAWLQPWEAPARTALQQDLANRISSVVIDAWYADFTQTRPAGAGIMAQIGITDGDDTVFRQWCVAQAEDGLTRLLRKYPVLGRLMSVTSTNWAASTRAMIQRLHQHRDDIERLFGIAVEDHIADISPGLSDPHRSGQTVAILGFASGTRLVYKPKDLRIEHQFQALIRDINSYFGDTKIHEITVLPGDGPYGFTSHVERRPARTAELPDFYVAAGRLLAVLYVLGATDAHHENLIAVGDSIALIDPETLFHIEMGEGTQWSDTVLRTGMLPNWERTGFDGRHLDISGLGAENLAHRSGPGWAHLNTDDMVLTTVTRPAGPAPASPVDPPQNNPLQHHTDDLVRGMRELYQAAENPDFAAMLLRSLHNFAGLPQRVVLRATRVYGIVARNAATAAATADPNARAFALESLSRAALLSATREPLYEVFRNELQEMESLDIPYFTHVLGTSTVHGALGPIPGMKCGDPLAQAEARIRGLGPADLAWQERLVRASIRARFMTTDRAARRPPAQPVRYPEPTAASVLEQVVESATSRGPDEPFEWVALTHLPDGDHVRLGIIGTGWYDGRCGIAAVQWLAGHQNPRTVQPVFEVLDSPDDYLRFRFLRDQGLGFEGVGGLLRWLLMTGDRTRATALLDDLSPELIHRDEQLDLIAGAAGLIAPLAAMADVPNARPLIVTAAERLAQRQLPSGGWASSDGSQPLTGLAHGAAGMGLALLTAGATLGEQTWVQAGARAFAYEADVFDADAGNWPDFRPEATGPMTAWCHGAAGIGLSRLRALQLLPDHHDASRWHEDVEVAMRTTATAPLPAADHLCCGLSGRAAVLRIAGREWQRTDWLDAADSLTQVVRRGYRGRGRFAVPLDDAADPGSVTPGLMTGLSGVAAHLLSIEQDSDLSGFLL